MINSQSLVFWLVLKTNKFPNQNTRFQAEQEDKVPERPETELAEAFRLFDTKADSKIDWDELKAALEAAGETVEVSLKLIT